MEKYIPYYVNLQFQYKTYKNIGKSNKIDFLAKKNVIYKVRKIFRKLFNKKEEKYKDFDTFSQWENYICEKFVLNNSFNVKDFIHYLKKYKRNSVMAYEMIGAIIVPMYVFLLTIGMTLLMNTDAIKTYGTSINEIREYMAYGFCGTNLILLMVLIVLMSMYKNCKSKADFYKDLITILKEKTTNCRN